jgi:hypothetical protein
MIDIAAGLRQRCCCQGKALDDEMQAGSGFIVSLQPVARTGNLRVVAQIVSTSM